MVLLLMHVLQLYSLLEFGATLIELYALMILLTSTEKIYYSLRCDTTLFRERVKVSFTASTES